MSLTLFREISPRFALRNPRIAFNLLRLSSAGVRMSSGAWIRGHVDLSLAPGALVTIGDEAFIPRRIEIIGNDRGKIEIGNRVTVDTGARLHVANDATLSIGDRVTIGPYNMINAFDDVTIGDLSMLGPYVNINSVDHGMERGSPMRDQFGLYGPVVIGKDCWIGSMVVITRGVTVGEGAVVAAGSVVTHDIPPFTVAAGVPCRPIYERPE